MTSREDLHDLQGGVTTDDADPAPLGTTEAPSTDGAGPADDVIDATEKAISTAADPPAADPSIPDPSAAADPPAATDPEPDPLADGLSVQISEDRMTATLTLPPLMGAPTPDPSAIVEYLRDEHRLVDVDKDAVDQAVIEATGSESKATAVVVARGAEAVPGEDGRLEWLGDFFESRALKMPDGRVDHYHHTKVSVCEGQPILKIHPPSRGQPGTDVVGNTVKAHPGSEAEIELDETVRRDERDASLVCAARPGMVEFYRGKVLVSEVLIVDEVDFSSGSIDFEGAVQVRNSVAPKFTVAGSGTVIIGGPVENARVESKKSITIDKGVMGKGDAVVTCAGDLSIGFARETAIHCGGRLDARRELLWCEGEVHGDLMAETGRIVGGHWRAGGRVVADEVGSREEVTTIITLGEAPEQNRALKLLTRDRKKYQEQLVEFRRKYLPMIQGRLGRIGAKEREALEQRLFLYQRQASRSRKREYVLRKKLNIQRRASFLWVKTMIFASTRLRMNGGKHVHEFKEEQPGPVCVRYDADTRSAVIEHIGLEDCASRFR